MHKYFAEYARLFEISYPDHDNEIGYQKATDLVQNIINGERTINNITFTDIEGGFGPNSKCILAKDIAEIHGRPLHKINENINNNRNRFKDGVDIIDLKTYPSKGYVLEALKTQGILAQSQIDNANNIYPL